MSSNRLSLDKLSSLEGYTPGGKRGRIYIFDHN